MRLSLLIWYTLLLSACRSGDNTTQESTAGNSKLNSDTSISEVNINGSGVSAYDSLANSFVDTTTLKGKRQWIMNHFLIDNDLVSPEFDSLFDLTYDGFDDYVIGHYGKSGTGLKNLITVYLYDEKRDCYSLNEKLSTIPNPSFYLEKKIITGFYIGNGGGTGVRLEWIGNDWVATKEFEVDGEGDSTKWEINYPRLNKKQIVIHPFQMIPPEKILETKVNIY